ncbi:MAG TPA: transglycosylase SLT domain-containing protein [Agriterribacter sp.]|nr:transglycosylase SLT domain-containing protein [Agriterribacter sp.]
MNRLLKGFGCLVFVLCMSFSVKAEEKQDSSGLRETDTSIAVTEMVIAAAVSSPSANENTGGIIIEEEAAPEAMDAPKELVIKQNNYSTLHPMAIAFVRDYEKKHEARLEKITFKYARQMALIDKIMIRHELPAELKYLALIESEMFNGAVSRKGAVGPWQFMAPTGRLMGLTINQHRDERRDLTKSTHAAAKYLKILHNQFNDWLLVIAAYNGGASRVASAIKKSGSHDFWKLQYYLPAESRAHVKKYVAARYILEKKEAEEAAPLLNMEKLVAENLSDLSVLHISGKYNIHVIAEALEMEVEVFNLYNPGFEKEVVTHGYNMRLPKDKMKRFREKRQEILNDSVEMLLRNNSTVFSNDKSNYPEAIHLPKTKAIVSTAAEQRTMKRK